MIPEGTHHNITPTDYHAWRFDPENPSKGPISNSLLKQYVSLGPLAFRYAPAMKSTKAMDFGSLVDCLLFTPELFPREFVGKEECPDLDAKGGFGSKKGQAWRDEKLAAGATIIDAAQREAAAIAVQRLNDTPISAEILEDAAVQVALSHVGASGIPMKALLDIVPQHLDHDDCLADLKTTSLNIHDDDALSRQVGQLKYHWQAANYLFLWNKLNPRDKRKRWKIIWQSSSAPYEVRVTEMDELMIEAGRTAIQSNMPRLLRDIKTNSWLSPFRNRETVLAPHNPTVYAEERALEVMGEVEG